MADKRSIYQFESGQGQQNSLLLMDNPDVSASSGYTTEKLSIGELGAVIGAILYTQLLDTNVKNIFGAINELADKIGAITEYSTTEKAVGKWIDGSTIYQKTLYIASMPDGSSSETDYEFGDFEIDMVVDYSAILFTSSKDQFIPMPYIYTGSALADIQFGFAVRNDKSYIGIRSEGVDRSTQSGYITIKYTKAT